jgi:hypothetical protein
MHVTRLMPFAGVFVLLAALLFVPPAAFAHHSFAMFDRGSEISVSGRVERVLYANPHVWLVISVADGENQEQVWELEGGNLMGLYRGGWYKDTVNPGDMVTVQLHPRVDGEPGGSIMTVTQEDGTVLHGG